MTASVGIWHNTIFYFLSYSQAFILPSPQPHRINLSVITAFIIHSCSSTVEHNACNTKVTGSIPRECMNCWNVYLKCNVSHYIKASAKCKLICFSLLSMFINLYNLHQIRQMFLLYDMTQASHVPDLLFSWENTCIWSLRWSHTPFWHLQNTHFLW